MKDEINVKTCATFEQVKEIIDDEIDYYNNDRYQWPLAKLSPNEFYQYAITGVYPLSIQPPKEFQDNPPLSVQLPIPTAEEIAEPEPRLLQDNGAQNPVSTGGAAP